MKPYSSPLIKYEEGDNNDLSPFSPLTINLNPKSLSPWCDHPTNQITHGLDSTARIKLNDAGGTVEVDNNLIKIIEKINLENKNELHNFA